MTPVVMDPGPFIWDGTKASGMRRKGMATRLACSGPHPHYWYFSRHSSADHPSLWLWAPSTHNASPTWARPLFLCCLPEAAGVRRRRRRRASDMSSVEAAGRRDAGGEGRRRRRASAGQAKRAPALAYQKTTGPSGQRSGQWRRTTVLTQERCVASRTPLPLRLEAFACLKGGHMAPRA
ncbi:hypothetical protein BS50DRAFT_306182, partial [Corynespora cassiicola Philippines]